MSSTFPMNKMKREGVSDGYEGGVATGLGGEEKMDRREKRGVDKVVLMYLVDDVREFMEKRRAWDKVRQCVERIGAQLLYGTVVYPGKEIQVTWRNTKDTLLVDQMDVEGPLDQDSFTYLILEQTKIEVVLQPRQQQQQEEETKHVHEMELFTTTKQRILSSVLQKVGGLKEAASGIIDHILIWKQWHTYPNAVQAYRPPVGVLLHGLPGTGKSALIQAVASSMNIHQVIINGPDTFQKNSRDSENYLLEKFDQAKESEPSVLIIEELDSIALKRHTRRGNQLEKSILAIFISQLKSLERSRQKVIVLGSTNRLDVLDSTLFTEGLLHVVHIKPPTQDERLDIMKRIVRPFPCKFDDSLLVWIAHRTSGYVGADLLNLCRQAAFLSIKRRHSVMENVMHQFDGMKLMDGEGTDPSQVQVDIAQDDFILAMDHVQPSVMRKVHQTSTSSLSMTSVVGLHEQKHELHVGLVLPLTNWKSFTSLGALPPRGILLYGAAGSGKTMLALALAGQVKGLANFLPVQCTELLSKVVGETEKNIAQVFETARNAAPCILFLDQIESIAPPRGFDSSSENTFDRMLSTLLIEMDGVTTSSSFGSRGKFSLSSHVVVLAATTDRDLLDESILRPGRFDMHVKLDLPDRIAREEMFHRLFQEIPVDVGVSLEEIDVSMGAYPMKSPKDLVSYLAQQTVGLSCAHLQNLCREAALLSLRQDIHATCVRVPHFLEAMKLLQIPTH